MGRYTGEYWNDVRQYHRHVSIAQDALLIVNAEANSLSGDISRERIVIPKPLVPALLYHMHNKLEQHPPKSQQKNAISKTILRIKP